MPSWKTPTDQQIEAVLLRIRSPDFETYFFSRLDNPLWIAPLRQRGVFERPPAPVVAGDGQPVHAVWQASKFLARMAPADPEAVSEIFSGLTSENPFVVGDRIAAARAMPPDFAKRLVPGIVDALRGHRIRFYLPDAAALCASLADGGEPDAAFTLAEGLFGPRLGDTRSYQRTTDDHWFFEALDRVIPSLVQSRPARAIDLLVDWTCRAIRLHDGVDDESGEDHSLWWRPAVEEHAQNSDFYLASGFVSRLRSAAETSIREGLVPLDDVLHTLTRAPFALFRRLRLHLVNYFAEDRPELARGAMLDRELFDDPLFKHEYATLLRQRFGMLTEEEQELWLGWVDEGPDADELTAEDASARKGQADYWRFSRLHWLRSQLEGGRLHFYQKMLSEHGEPLLSDLHVSSTGGAWGSSSPMTVEELSGMTFSHVIDRVATWRPQGGRAWLAPSVSGLSDTFQQYVATAPEDFSAQAVELIGKPAIYVRGFLRKMSEALEQGRHVDVGSVLELCSWVVKRPVDETTIPADGDDALVDKDWQWTRDEASRFVKQVCKSRNDREVRYPLELRERLWQVVEPLYHDSTVSYISEAGEAEDPRDTDYFTRALNSPRGKAVEAALEYARWVANHVKTTEDEADVVPGGFASMPEVREMLEWLLDPENRTVEALAVIGVNVGLLFWIDRAWLADNVERLFDLGALSDGAPVGEGWAAWNAFLVWVRPHGAFYRLFQQQFATALEIAGDVPSPSTDREAPLSSLARHVVILYGRGEIPLEGEGSPVAVLLEKAPAPLRRHAVGFVGRVLWREAGLPEAMVTRFMRFWEAYWAGHGKEDARADPDAWLFGPWFASEQLPPEWALEHLTSFVQVATVPEPDHAVVTRLNELTTYDVGAAVEILDRMVRGDLEGWRIHAWREAARSILSKALAHGGEAAERAAVTVDYLARRGYPHYIDG